MASPTARTPWAGTTATIVGPEPERVAPYAPASRAALVTSSYPGTSARRNGTWSTSSSPAASSRGSACASPWTRAALLAAARAASACGSMAGSAARARFVSTVNSGTANTSASDGCIGNGVTTRPSGSRSTRLAPPNRAGGTLSGWPSSSLASSARAGASSLSPSSPTAAAAPATVAAAEEPRPRATGMSDSAVSARPAGGSCRARRHAATKPRYSRSASGAVSRARSVPPRSIATGFPGAAGATWAVTRSQRPTATPTQSNPAPRLDVEPATRTVTLARIPVSFGKQKSPRNATPRALTTTTSVVCMFNTRRGRWMRQGAAMGKIRVGILGATGTVGQRFLQLLERHPQFTVTALAASDRSQGRPYAEACTWRLPGDVPPTAAALVVQAPEPPLDCDVVFSSLPSDVAGPVETRFARAGYRVVTNSSPHRMDDAVPLLIPEVNPDQLALLDACKATGGGFIVANPNCSTVMIALALAPLADRFGVAAVVVTTLQAISGAGYPGVASLDITDNVVPYIAGEEEKIERETLKILGRVEGKGARVRPAEFPLSAQCHRVPVVDGHMAAIRVQLGRKAEPAELRDAFTSFRGVPQELGLHTAPPCPILVRDEPDRPQPRLDRDAGGGMSITVGRIARDRVLSHRFVALSHNTIRGAAGAAILNAELLLAEGLLNVQ